MSDKVIELSKGDIIRSESGLSFIIDRILMQDINVSENNFRNMADIEFIDPRGNYHHYQSWNDGGEIITKSGRTYKFEIEKSNFDRW